MPRPSHRPKSPLSKSPVEVLDSPPLSRREWQTLCALVVLAAMLRCAWPGRMALEHFDEGVYAANLWFGPEQGGRYPFQYLYAPPLLPWTIEWGIVLFGHEIGPFLPALLLGTATVPLAWRAARDWFGPAAAPVAGLLVAASDVHILYSRTALTDAPLAFFLLLAVWLYSEAVRRERFAWSLAAGCATTLAWWTKYNGWLPLAVAAAGAAAWVAASVVRPLPTHRNGSLKGYEKSTSACRLRRVVPPLFVMTLLAVLLWWPVLWNLAPVGGYGTVAANHAGYVVGLAGWPAAAWRQLCNLWLLSGPVSATALAAAILCGTLGSGRLPSRLLMLFAATMAVLLFALGPVLPLALLAGGGLIFSLRNRSSQTASLGNTAQLGPWLLTAWLVGLSLATPYYTPFPRLALPWLLAVNLGAAAAVPPIAQRLGHVRFPLRYVAGAVVAALMVLAGCVPAAAMRVRAGDMLPAWDDRTSASRLAVWVLETIHAEQPAPSRGHIVFVLNEPACFDQLQRFRRDDDLVLLTDANLPFADSPPPAGTTLWLVIDQQVGGNAALDRRWQAVGSQFIEYRPAPVLRSSRFVALNWFSPGVVAAGGEELDKNIRLFRLTSARR